MMRNVGCLVVAALLAAAAPASALMSLRPGDAPPAFSLPDLSGKRVALADLAGSPAVVVFFSTWSPRSAEALADLTRHAGAYGARGLKLVAVNVDGENLDAVKAAAVREYAAARELPFPVLLDGGLETYAAWGVMAAPTAVVLDAGGRIVYVLPGYPWSLREELRDEIERVLGRSAATPAPTAPAAMSEAQRAALAQLNLGRQLLARGDLEGALASFRRAAAEDPGLIDAAIMIARGALTLGDTGEAERLARQVSPETINRGDLRSLLGSLMLQKGEVDGAERVFRALRERLPREGWGPWGLGLVALARGDRVAALPLLLEGRTQLPEHPEGEAFMRRWFRDRWMRREFSPEDDGFVQAFPALNEVRERLRSLYR